jgi:hypothetical protein
MTAAPTVATMTMMAATTMITMAVTTARQRQRILHMDVEWVLTPLVTRDSNHGLHKVSRLMKDGHRQAGVIPLSSLVSNVHLLPRFGPSGQQGMNSYTVLEETASFYVNPFSDMDNYITFS